MKKIYDFTRAMKASQFVRGAAAYQELNQLRDNTGSLPATSIPMGLYLYCYDNSSSEHPIHDKNTKPERPHGKVICPAGHRTVKSGKFVHGLVPKIVENHWHLWRPAAGDRFDEPRVWPKALKWFLVFETDPGALEGKVRRETILNRATRKWLNDTGLTVKQPRMEHRWIKGNVTVQKGREFLEGVLRQYPHW